VVKCIEAGLPLLLENLSESIDAVLDPVIGKLVTKRGRATVLKLGDAEVEYNPNFRCAAPLSRARRLRCRPGGRMQSATCTARARRLYLATKLANPHYRPEIAAQTTLVNFCVTEEGLEEQLLAAVVAHERADLQQAAAALVAQLAQYTITLTELEDNLLARLANSQVGAPARALTLGWVRLSLTL
jgi:dynein heavy chain